MAELQQKVEAQIKLPDGYYLEWGGQFQNMERAGPPEVIIPITIAAIFFLLFLLFNSLRFATLIITVLPLPPSAASSACSSAANTCRCRPRWVHRAVGHRRAQRRGAGVVHPGLREEGRSVPARRWSRAPNCASGR